MFEPITKNTNREALLRYLDLKNEVDMLVRKYQDLGFAVINQCLIGTAYEVGAVICLPVDYVPPKEPTNDPAP